MTPVLPQVDPVPWPAPAVVFWVLLMITFTLHVIAMNAVLGGSIVAVVARWAAGRGDAYQARLASFIARAMPVAIAAAVTFGVAALLFLQVLYGRAFFSSSVLMARWWIAVVPLLVAAYYAAYALAGTPRRGLALALVCAAVFVTVAFILSNNMGLMLRVEALPALFARNARGTYLNLGDRTMVPRYVHMLAGALGTAGVLVALAAVGLRKRDPAFASWLIRCGAAWFAAATVVNFPVGLWWVGVLPMDVLKQLLGGNVTAALVLAAALAAILTALALLAVASQADEAGGWVVGAAGALAVGLVLMLLTRDFVRGEALRSAGLTAPAWMAPQWDLIALFLALLAVALSLVAWMAMRLRSSAARVPPAESPV